MLLSSTFTRNKEDFTCEFCAKTINGNGYTNHCPECFYSKHVDINPGDRASECLGMMEPIGYYNNNRKGLVIIHKCQSCKIKKTNKSSENDNISYLVEMLKNSPLNY